MTKTITIGRLAKASGLSRSTLLYYDRLGLLRPVNRSEGNYRLYSLDEVERLRRICVYRDAGVPLKQVAQMLDDDQAGNAESASVLKRHLEFLEEQVKTLRNQQRQVILLLEQFTSRSSARASGEVEVRRSRARSAGHKTGPHKAESSRGQRAAAVRAGEQSALPSGLFVFIKRQRLEKETEMVTKDRWVEIMKAAGFGDDDMRNWHRQFERLEPEAHQEFLESLGIDSKEISQIRQWSKG